MKFERTAAFDSDYGDLPEEHRELIRKVLPRFHTAAERSVHEPAMKWPMRVRHMSNNPGVWEVTWNFERPDLRGTFEWIEIEGEKAVRWRRVGDHSIFTKP